MTGKTKILYILLAFVSSVLLWIYVVGVENPQKEDTITDVPVTFIGVDEMHEDHGLVITSERNVTVDLTVFGSMKDIASLNTNKESIVVEADLSRITTSGTKQISYTVELPNSDVTLLDRSPYYLNVKLETVRTTPMEVRLKNNGSVVEGFIAKSPQIEPASLQVTGPEELVGSVAYAEVVWTRENMDSTITLDLDYTLYNAEGEKIPDGSLTANYDVVTVTIPVQKTKTIPLAVEFIDGAGAAAANAKHVIEPSEITIAGETNVVDGLNSITVGVIDLAEVIGSADYSFDINLPNGVESLSGEEKCDVTVELEGLAVESIVCDNITAIHPPEGFVAEIITVQRTVTLRGPVTDMAQVEDINVRIVVDLSKSEITESGRYTADATVYVDGFPSVGVLGVQRIAVEIIPEDEVPPVNE